MTTWIALLRGVNVGGHNKCPMADLKKLCEKLGWTAVRTYINSGNVVFEAAEKNEEKLRRQLSEAITKKFGFTIDVVVRTQDEAKKVLADNPFAKRKDVKPGLLLVVFLSADPGKTAHAALKNIKDVPEEIIPGKREIYIYYPNGQGRPTLKFRDVEKAIGDVSWTGRNLNIVAKLAEML